jgi:RHS repeat-associated protein
VYVYDALGRRISKTTTNGTTCFYYDGARIIEEHDCGITVPVVLSTYTYGNYIDEALACDTGSTRYYFHQNSLWSVHALTDFSGAVVERYAYDAYGKLTVLDANYSPLTTPPLTPVTFTGRWFDFENGNYDYRARPYSPSLGRFLSRDPLGYVDGMNLYEYVRSNPQNRIDSTGHNSRECNPSSFLDGVTDKQKAIDLIKKTFPNDPARQTIELRKWEKHLGIRKSGFWKNSKKFMKGCTKAGRVVGGVLVAIVSELVFPSDLNAGEDEVLWEMQMSNGTNTSGFGKAPTPVIKCDEKDKEKCKEKKPDCACEVEVKKEKVICK